MDENRDDLWLAFSLLQGALAAPDDDYENYLLKIRILEHATNYIKDRIGIVEYD